MEKKYIKNVAKFCKINNKFNARIFVLVFFYKVYVENGLSLLEKKSLILKLGTHNRFKKKFSFSYL